MGPGDCPNKECHEMRQEDHKNVGILLKFMAVAKTRWSFLFAIPSIALIIIGLWMRSDLGHKAEAQSKANAEITEIKKDIDKQQDKHQSLEIAVGKIETKIEAIQKSQERQEENSKEILRAINDLKQE